MEESYLSRCSLLYVEDEEEIRSFLQRRLEKKVKKLYIAQNGQEGLELYEKYKPDLILTDVTMPIKNGITMSTEIKKLNPKVPIIIMSAHSDTSYLLSAIDIGINNYLIKPVDKEKLQNTLESCAKNLLIEEELANTKKQSLHQSRFALLGEMTSMIAHQWRQPLNTIALSLMTLHMSFEKQNIAKSEINKLGEVEHYIQELSSLIDSFAHIYKPSTDLSSENIDEVLKESVENFKSSIPDEIEIHEFYHTSKPCNIYKNEFIHICLNILNNAYEHIEERQIEEATIVVRTEDIKDGVKIEFIDNAGGIEEEIMDKIFDPYFSTKDGKNGNGLGLYMTKLVIEEHLDGKIEIENHEEGLIFSIILKV